MEAGWVSIHRQIKDNWIWQDKPFSKGQAWIDLLLMANHTEKKFALGNEVVTVKRGALITSEKKLMENWGWSKGKVRAFLKTLEDDGMINKKTDRKKTTINIVNYSFFQDSETTERPQTDHEQTANGPRTDHEQTANGPQTDTNNNDNNENNLNNENNVNNGNKKKSGAKPKEPVVYYPLDEKLNQAVIDFIEFRKKIKAPMTDKGVNIMINKLDKMTDDNNEKISILEQSIMNGWKGVFPLDKRQKKVSSNPFAERLKQMSDDEDCEELIF